MKYFKTYFFLFTFFFHYNIFSQNINEKIVFTSSNPYTFEEIISKLSLKRFAEPKEIANVALFLSSELSDYITGQVIRVDGGM